MSGHDELSGDRGAVWLNSSLDYVHPRDSAANEPQFDARGVISDSDAKALAVRNVARIEEAKRRLGSRYLLHPSKRVRSVHVRGVLR